MASSFSNFIRENLTSAGREQKRREEIRKNFGIGLQRDGQYGIYNTYPQHYKVKEIFYPRQRLSFFTRDQFYIDNPTLRTVIDKKVKEVNRNGISIQKLFVKKCMREYIEPCSNPIHKLNKAEGKAVEACSLCPDPKNVFGQEECGEEYETEVIRCTYCAFPTRPPKIEHKISLRKAMKRRNKNKRSLKATLIQQGIDVEKHDNGFMITDFTYFFDDEYALHPTRKVWIQAYQGQPQYIRPIIEYDGSLGTYYYTCINHREVFEKIQNNNTRKREYADYPRCKERIDKNETILCGKPLQKVEYVYLRFNIHSTDAQQVDYSYIDGEVQHVKNYSPSTAMGISLIDSLYYTVLQLNGQEKWIAEYYLKMRMFKGFLDIPHGQGQSHEKVQQMFASEFIKWRQDSWYMPILSSPAASKGINYHRIDDSPKEMQFLENRMEGRRQISAAYGVSNQFMGDTSTGAGLNNQGLELAVMNRAVATTQSAFDDQLLMPWCASILDISIEELEYIIAYNPNEEQDLMAELQRDALEAGTATTLQGLGANITFDEAGKLIASAPIEGMPLIPASSGSMKPFEEVEDMSQEGQARERRAQSKPMEGAPNEPRVQGSNLTVKGNGDDPYEQFNNLMKMFKMMNEANQDE